MSPVHNGFQYRNGHMCNRGGWQYQPPSQSGVQCDQRVNSKRNPCIHTIQTTAHWFIQKLQWIFRVIDNPFQKPCPKSEDLARLNDEINENRHGSGANTNQSGQHHRFEHVAMFGKYCQTQTNHDSHSEPGQFIQYFSNFFHQQTGEIPSTVHEHAPSDVVK